MGIYAIFNIGGGVIALLTVVGNSIVLVAILRNRFLHTPTNVFIGHLATADVIMGLLVCPISIIANMNLDMEFHKCILLNSVIMIIVNAESFMLLCITGERFAAIRYPYQYHKIIDIPRANYISLAAWASGILTGLIPMFGWNPGVENYGGKCKFVAVISYSYLVYFGFFVMVLVPIIVMTIVYIYIGRVVQRHLNNSYDLQSRFKIKMKKRVRTTKSFEVLIVVFFVLKLPLSILLSMTFYDAIPWSRLTHQKLVLMCILLNRCNAMVNPFFYAAGTSKIKAAMWNVVLCRGKSHRFSNNISLSNKRDSRQIGSEMSSRFTSTTQLTNLKVTPAQYTPMTSKYTNAAANTNALRSASSVSLIESTHTIALPTRNTDRSSNVSVITFLTNPARMPTKATSISSSLTENQTAPNLPKKSSHVLDKV